MDTFLGEKVERDSRGRGKVHFERFSKTIVLLKASIYLSVVASTKRSPPEDASTCSCQRFVEW
jgi:hypothetical protein